MDRRFSARKLEERDWETVSEWYRRDGDLPPMLELMPKESAFIMEFEGKMAAVGFLFLTNSGLTFIEGLETNKDLPEITQGRGLRELVWHMVAVSKSLGYRGVCGFPAEDNFSVAAMYFRSFSALQMGKLRRLVLKLL